MNKETFHSQLGERSDQKPEKSLDQELEGELFNLGLSREDVDLRIEPDMHSDHIAGRIKGYDVDIVCSDTTGAVLSGKIDEQPISLDDARRVRDKYLRVAEISTEIGKGRVNTISVSEALKDIL